jgi:hypothetical protein
MKKLGAARIVMEALAELLPSEKLSRVGFGLASSVGLICSGG